MTIDQIPWAGLAAAGLLLLAAAVLGMRLMLGRAWDRGYGAGWNDGWGKAWERQDEPLLDPDCRDGKHGSCVGGPCECPCHREAAGTLEPLPPQVFPTVTANYYPHQTLALPAARPPPESGMYAAADSRARVDWPTGGQP